MINPHDKAFSTSTVSAASVSAASVSAASVLTSTGGERFEPRKVRECVSQRRGSRCRVDAQMLSQSGWIGLADSISSRIVTPANAASVAA